MPNTIKTAGTEVKKRFLICKGSSYDVTNMSGKDLVEKLQKIARDNGISRFDICDIERKNLSPADIEAGNFTGDLSLQIENLK